MAGDLLSECQGTGTTTVPGERKKAAMSATAKEETPKLGTGIYHPSARPMEVVKDDKGKWWLCDKGVDRSHDLEKQGCWPCGGRAFTRND